MSDRLAVLGSGVVLVLAYAWRNESPQLDLQSGPAFFSDPRAHAMMPIRASDTVCTRVWSTVRDEPIFEVTF